MIKKSRFKSFPKETIFINNHCSQHLWPYPQGNFHPLPGRKQGMETCRPDLPFQGLIK
jgi:hypothetical protein